MAAKQPSPFRTATGLLRRSPCRLILCIVALCGLGSSDPAAAQEGTHYLPGAFNIQDFVAPPAPGIYGQLFATSYRTGTFTDRNGDAVTSIQVGGQTVPVEIDLDVFAATPTLYWMTPWKVLGWDLGVAAALPLQNTSVGAALPRRGIDFDDSNFGVGDLFVQPVLLGLHPGRVELMAGYFFYAPTAKYEDGASDNVGLGYWTHGLQGAAMYRGGVNRLWSVAGMFTYNFHSEKEGVDLTPGDALTAEWGISKILLGPLLEVGIAGYSQWQISDDSGTDVTRDPDIHDRVHAVGPQLSWTSQSQRVNLAFRYLWEFGARDRFEGQLGQLTVTLTF